MLAFLTLWLAVAAPGPSSPPPPTPQDEARRFAIDVASVLDQVADGYVRPVPREKLYEAALAGMHVLARRPVPAALAADVRKAVAAPPPPNLGRTGTAAPCEPREDLLARACQSLGLSRHDATHAACRAVARLLDPHSGLVTAEEQRRAVGLDHESHGLGLETRGATVEAVHPGGPAQAGGLRPGDVLLSVNDHPMSQIRPALLAALKNDRVRVGPTRLGSDDPAPASTLVRLRYRRPGQEGVRQVELLRMRYRPETVQGAKRKPDNSWEHLLDGGMVAHVRVTSLSRGTADELRNVVEGLVARGTRALVLDLRWCPGGYLNEAVDVAGLFIGDELIATVKGRGREDSVYRGAGLPIRKSLPVVVLVNNETSGGAELVAAALQDHGRATVAGQRTLGKASVQTPIPTGLEGVAFKLTGGTFIRPSGKNLHRFNESQSRDDWGVIPDEDCRVSPGLGARMKADWLLWSLRPSSSLERLALDDPTADTQRRAAAKLAARLAADAERLSRRE